MPRNSSGTYSLPAGNPVVSGTLIEASWANTTLSDLATSMTNSLSRNGEGGMLAPLRVADGSVSTPGLAFTNETSSGLYRAGSGDVRLSITGAQVAQFLATGLAVTGTLSSTGNATVGGTLAITGATTLTGALTANGGVSTTTVAASGNTTVGGTLSVTGATTLSNNLILNGSGARILGDFSNSTVVNRTMFQTSATNGVTILPVIPNGSAAQSLFRAYNNSTPTNASYIDVTVDGTVAAINSNREGSGTMLPLSFGVNNAERMRIDTAGNVGIGTSSPGQRLTLGALGVFRLQTGAVAMDCTPTPGATDGFVWNTSLSSYYAWSIAGTERARIDASGNLLVATTTVVGTGKISLNFGASGDGIAIISSGTSDRSPLTFYNGNGFVGRVSTSGSSTAYLTSSDYRLKENIQPMTGALAKVAALKPCTYKWKVDGSDGQGFIAHELQAVVPECVTGEKDAVDAEGKPVYQGIDTSFLVATLTAALQELHAKVQALEARLASDGPSSGQIDATIAAQ